MAKIVINNLSYSYIQYYNPIFEHINLVLDTNWKLGLIGRNGRGKTTFLNLIRGKLAPDLGKIIMDVNAEYFPYEVDCKYIRTIDIIKENISGLKKMENLMEEIVLRNDKSRGEEYSILMDRYIDLDGFSIEGQIKKEMYLMQLPECLLEQDYSLLSGGEKTKIQIITLFLRKDAFVLLDEPTNHLDIQGKRALTRYLKRKKGFIIATHDREFLNQTIDHVLSINKSTIELEKGNYYSWRENKDKEELFELRASERLMREVSQLENSIQKSRNWGDVGNHQKYEFRSMSRANGSKSYMVRAKRAEENIKGNLNKKKQLLKDFELTKPLFITQDEFDEDVIVKVEKLSYNRGGRSILRDLSFSICRGDRIWVRGKNGCGKSTLLKLLSAQLPLYEGVIERAEGMQITEIFQIPLWTKGMLVELVNDTTIIDNIIEICLCFDLKKDILYRPIDTLSSGEMRKLDVARGLATNNHLILLDEPLNYMDIYFREQLEEAIIKTRPTIIFAEHDEMFGNRLANKIIKL